MESKYEILNTDNSININIDNKSNNNLLDL